MGPSGTLRVRRHLVRTRVAGGGSGRSVTASLGESLNRALADRLPAMLASGGDESVWVVRRLDVRAAVSGSWPAGRIADVLAGATLGALTATLRRGADGDAVVWFPDRAAFLGRFLADLASGRAAGRWEYAGLAGVAGRPQGAVVADVVRREPAAALAAIVGLAPADRRQFLTVLAPADAAAVLAALAGSGSSAAGDPAPLVVSALQRLLDRSDLPDDWRSAALALFLEVARVESGAPPVGTDVRARDLAHLVAVLGDTVDEATAATVAAGDWRRVSPRDMGQLAALGSWPAPARREAVRQLMQVRVGRPGPGGVATMTTGLGGMFLLLPLLEELPWDDAAAGWPALQGVRAAVLLRYLAVIGALGAARNRATIGDPVLRLALGIPRLVDPPALDAWSSAVGPERARETRRAWAAGLVRRGKVSGEVTLAPLDDGVVAVDGARGIWLGRATAAPASVRDLVESVEAVTVAATEPWIEACLDGDRPPPDPADARLLTRFDDQVRYATVGPPLALAPAVGETVTLAAQALGRELAWRLPGFSRSSLPYLAENFLAFDACVTVEPERFAVAVGDPPLHLVLTLAGLNRTCFRLAATGDREWKLARTR